MKLTRTQLNNVVIFFYVLILCTYGIIKQFFGWNMITDLAGALMLLVLLLGNNFRYSVPEKQKILFILVFLFTTMTLIVSLVGMYSPMHSFTGFRNYIFYLYFGLSVTLIDNKKVLENALNFIMLLGVLVCLFGDLQFVFYDLLPEQLRRFPGAAIELVYGLGGVNPLRINGMLENTIVFGNFAVTILIVILGKLFAYKKKSKLDIISLVIVAASVILTFGRIAIIGGLFSIILTYIYCSRKNSLGRAFKIIIILVVVFGVVFAFFGDSIVVKRLIGEGTSTNVSNQIHMEKAQNGLQAVLQNWLMGVGNGTQGYTRGNLTAIVSDGGWLSWALELGVPTTLVFFAVFFAFLVFSNKCKKEYTDEFNIWINSAAVTTMVIFMFSSIFNSSYLARANYGISWLLIGLSLATNRLFEQNKKPGV